MTTQNRVEIDAHAVRSYLRQRDDNGAMDEAADTQMRADLLGLLGESKLRLWPLVDQLIFLEDCAELEG